MTSGVLSLKWNHEMKGSQANPSVKALTKFYYFFFWLYTNMIIFPIPISINTKNFLIFE